MRTREVRVRVARISGFHYLVSTGEGRIGTVIGMPRYRGTVAEGQGCKAAFLMLVATPVQMTIPGLSRWYPRAVYLYETSHPGTPVGDTERGYGSLNTAVRALMERHGLHGRIEYVRDADAPQDEDSSDQTA